MKNSIITLNNYKRYLFNFNIKNLEELFLFVNENFENLFDIEFDESILTELSTSNNVKVRQYIAANENCSLKTLEVLSNDEDVDIRINVVLNKNCSIDLLNKFISDSEPFIKNAAEYILNH